MAWKSIEKFAEAHMKVFWMPFQGNVFIDSSMRLWSLQQNKQTNQLETQEYVDAVEM